MVLGLKTLINWIIKKDNRTIIIPNTKPGFFWTTNIEIIESKETYINLVNLKHYFIEVGKKDKLQLLGEELIKLLKNN